MEDADEAVLDRLGEDITKALETCDDAETRYHIRSAAQRVIIARGDAAPDAGR
jgi:hypothetical protein